MNLGIVSSTLIGGMVLLSIISLNVMFSQHSGETTFNHTTKVRTDAIADIITHDMRRMGYTKEGEIIKDPIMSTDGESAITFKSTTSDNTTGSIIDAEITWVFNKDENKLSRWVKGEGVEEGEEEQIMSRNTQEFELTLFDSEGNPTTAPGEAKQVKVFLVIENAVGYSNNSQKAVSSWENIITPRSLHFKSED